MKFSMKVSSEMLHKMCREAEKVWVLEFLKVLKETKDPFIKFIYDNDPLEQIYWDSALSSFEFFKKKKVIALGSGSRWSIARMDKNGKFFFPKSG